MAAEFDEFAKDYEQLLSDSIKLSGYEPAYFDEQKIKEVKRRFDLGLEEISFLNFGCGVGKSERFINKYFPGSVIHSADVSSESINEARQRNKEFRNITFHHFEKIQNFDPGVRFNIIFVANVFHHIPEDLHQKTLT